MKAAFDDRSESGTARRVTDLRLELYALRVECVALQLTRTDAPGLADTERPSCYDARGDD